MALPVCSRRRQSSWSAERYVKTVSTQGLWFGRRPG
jgi:hypothetical protein